MPPRLSTFSIVAADLERAEWGVVVQSKFLSVGSVVPWAEAPAGAIATQALANMRYGPEGLALLRRGLSAEEVVHRLTAEDPQKEHRQVGVVDAHGHAAAFTGAECMEWAGHVVGDGFACQGNILAGPDVVEEMARTMEATKGDLADRLLAALAAGQSRGGDRRGMQSAALYVAKPEGSYGGTTDRYIDVRVDDHPSPIEELRRVFHLYDMTLLNREDPATLVDLAGEVVWGIQRDLRALRFYAGPADGTWNPETAKAWATFLGVHNFENRERSDGKAWPSVLGYLHVLASPSRPSRGKARKSSKSRARSGAKARRRS